MSRPIRRWACRYVPTCKGEMVTVPSREVCKCCGVESCLGFTVPDLVWEQVMGDSQDVVCITCFDHQATELGVAWEASVQFWPVSGVTARASSV